MSDLKFNVMWTTISEKTKLVFREEMKNIVASEYNTKEYEFWLPEVIFAGIDAGACDYLYSCSYLDPHDIINAVEANLIEPEHRYK